MEDIYFQTVILRIKKPGGEIKEYPFIGVSAFSKQEWDSLIESDKTLEDVLAESDAVKLGFPIPIERALAGHEHKDLVQMIRNELIDKTDI